jgi:hypothetical protein
MGGFGSGEYKRKQPRKRAVEESLLVLEVRHVRSLFDHDDAGTLTWVVPEEGNRTVAEIDYSFTTDNPPTLTLRYRWRDEENVGTQICQQATRTHFGGRRWWFSCPWCTGRVGKLYLVPGDKHYRCRSCHNLTYECHLLLPNAFPQGSFRLVPRLHKAVVRLGSAFASSRLISVGSITDAVAGDRIQHALAEVLEED